MYIDHFIILNFIIYIFTWNNNKFSINFININVYKKCFLTLTNILDRERLIDKMFKIYL